MASNRWRSLIRYRSSKQLSPGSPEIDLGGRNRLRDRNPAPDSNSGPTGATGREREQCSLTLADGNVFSWVSTLFEDARRRPGFVSDLMPSWEPLPLRSRGRAVLAVENLSVPISFRNYRESAEMQP